MDDKARILIVEDNLDDVSLLLIALAKYFKDELGGVDVVHSAGEACVKLEEGNYHIVLLDLNLPDVRGTDAIQLLRKTCARNPTQIIIHTGDESRNIIKRCIRENKADDFLPKNLIRFAQDAIARITYIGYLRCLNERESHG